MTALSPHNRPLCRTGHVPHAVNVYIPPEVLQMHSTTVTLHQLTSLAISRPLLTRVQDHLKRMAADPTTSPSARDEHAPDTGPAAPEQEQHGTASDDAGFAPRILIYGASTDDHLSAAARRLLNEEDPAIQDTADHDDAKGPETVAVILARSIAAESAENTADAHNPKTLMVLRGAATSRHCRRIGLIMSLRRWLVQVRRGLPGVELCLRHR